MLSKEQGDEVRTFPLPDGRFAFHNVPAGKHYLEVELVGLVYSTVELTVGVAGDVNALLSDVINVRSHAWWEGWCGTSWMLGQVTRCDDVLVACFSQMLSYVFALVGVPRHKQFT